MMYDGVKKVEVIPLSHAVMTRKIRLNRQPVLSIDGYRETGRLWRRMRVVGFNTAMEVMVQVLLFLLCFLIR